ncbi:SwmB domain-containing protein [Clostridium coskatii]|uniref:Uncharacterized protein n=1 Tax=Clostridium coskatii TaxID=1705578 RepID=A0A166RDC3_9CLOT|nr:SwmB domain-containing protein [Clostridium coskatii]OAA90707.1 hypothetical protein WX73_02072 [Clostridium coskatii]OBR97457.1 hypothetical protein CLCOS_03130 [Clostridium coskatii]
MADINTSGVTTTGFNEKTMDHLLLDAGAVYKNFGLEDQIIVGATSGGNEFDAKAKIRQIDVDGVKAANAKGMEIIDNITTTLKCSFIEVSRDILQAALIANVDTSSDSNYDILTGKTVIVDSDYIKNLAWVGTLSGSNKPVIIVIENALCLDGLQLKTQDSKDNVLDVTFTAHADPKTPKDLPYKIYYPKLTDMVAFNLVSAAVSASKIILTMSDDVAATVPKDGFTATVAGSADVITAAARGTSNTKTIELTLTTAPTTGQAVTVAYSKPTDATKQVQSASGVVLDNIATTSVQNS